MKLDVDEVGELIRTEADPVELQRKLRERIEEAHPVPVFAENEEMPMYEFVERFKRAVCEGSEPRFWSWPVRIVHGPDGELLVALGTWAGKVK